MECCPGTGISRAVSATACAPTTWPRPLWWWPTPSRALSESISRESRSVRPDYAPLTCAEKRRKGLDADAVAGVSGEGKEVFLKDVWPSKEEVQHVEEHTVIASMFTELRSRMQVSSDAAATCSLVPLPVTVACWDA